VVSRPAAFGAALAQADIVYRKAMNVSEWGDLARHRSDKLVEWLSILKNQAGKVSFKREGQSYG